VDTRPNPNLYPDGGYFYVEADGTRFRGDGWRNLIQLVRDYRVRNGLPVRDPEVDVFNQYCARMPSHCRTSAPQPSQPHSMSFNQRVLQWFSNMLEIRRLNPRAFGRVPDDVAAQRAAICARCPRQQALSSACESCLNAVRSGRKVILDGAASQHQNLHACAALGEDCQTTVHIGLPPVDPSMVPPECWRRS